MRRLATAVACLVHSLAAASQMTSATSFPEPPSDLQWCHWGPWSVPVRGRECGTETGLYHRFRHRCCNGRKKRVLSCEGKSQEDRRRQEDLSMHPAVPCDPPRVDLGGHSDIIFTSTITPLISALACVGLLLSCCLLIARRRRQYRAMTLDRSLPGAEFPSQAAYGPQFHLGFSMSLTVRSAAQDSPPPPYELASRQQPPVAPLPAPPRSPPPLYEEVMSLSQTADVQHDRAS